MSPSPSVHGTLPTAATPSRRSLPDSVAYGLAAYVIGLGFFASLTPSPLYGRYSQLWHFSPLTLTLVYATYALGVLAALLLVGSASDDVGRRPVILGALAILMLSTAFFFFASSVTWLFVARGLQGLATGAAISSASAALLDLHPRRDAWGVGLANAVSSSLGIALGILTVSSLVELAPAPRMLSYAVLFLLLALAFVGAWFMPETVGDRQRLQLTFQRPHVPSVVRGPFAVAALTAISSWSLGGLFFSLGPQFGERLFDSTNAVLAGMGIVVLGAASATSQLLLGRTAPWLAACLGSITLAVGVILVVVAASAESGVAYVVGSVFCGVGFGIGFLGGLRALVGAIPPGHRASVMSAFYVVAYASLSVPAVLAGLVVGHLGIQLTFQLFGAVVVVLASATSLVALRTRPRDSRDA